MSEASYQLLARFWAKVDRRGPDECWLWLGANAGARSKRRGQFWNGRKVMLATHFALSLDGRSVGVGQCACHSCDTPSCVNPRHLWVGSQKENLLDAAAKRRNATQVNPEITHTRRLSREQVVNIRTVWRSLPSKEIAARLGVHFITVREARRGKTWKHINHIAPPFSH